MTDISSTLTLITSSIGIALSCLLFTLFRRRENRYFWQRVTWTRMSLLLMVLSACNSSAPTQTKPPITPLALTGTPLQTATHTKETDWTTYHRDNQRTGYLASTPDPHSLSKIWGKDLDGAVYAEPLVVGNRVIVATEGDTLYALDPTTGSVQWHTNVGSPVPQSSLPCGNIDPLGITGTPVYDPATGLVFAVAEITGPAHILVGLDATTGEVKVRRSVDTDGMDPRAHQERGALTLANGRVYINYGGLDGDCSDYIGRVVASRTDGQGPLQVYRVPTT
ncbi:MAG TPA: PQQ-binding-like beta-propeller repeat protein, partial [Ktedonobacteraceae bacterium]|nr:PQQ-binding-like beta-propeller repeat protein [Ktedonobacteraceae bacterium]